MVEILLLLALGNPTQLPTDHFDLLELNHCNGHYDQVIAYRWSHDYNRYDVAVWYIADKLEHYPTQQGVGRYTATYKASIGVRHLVAPMFRETWTSKDPEREHKNLMAEAMREGWCCER